MSNSQLRLRVFAGPNGSGKSTIINYIRSYEIEGKSIDFGFYINADDIASSLRRKRGFSFKTYGFNINKEEFTEIANSSGLINEKFDYEEFIASFSISNQNIHCVKQEWLEHLAQIIADFLRKKLLKQQQRFSFETVFSHPSKLDIMKEAVNAGYKVYLYFVSTESPEINKFRVAARVKKGGHHVPEDKIESRYSRSFELLHEAAQLAYQAYFFDNSNDGSEFKMFAHFKLMGGKKVWDKIEQHEVPNWFKIYYSNKVKDKQ